MFPPNLQKNIQELDKQISLLETECDNIESEKRENNSTGKVSGSSSRETTPKQFVNVGPPKRGVSLPTNSGSCPSGAFRKLHGTDSPTVVIIEEASRSMLSLGNSGSEESKSYKLSERKQKHWAPSEEVDIKSVSDALDQARSQILHKEVLIANPGETIEVTVTQKGKSPREVEKPAGRKGGSRNSFEMGASEEGVLMCTKHSPKVLERMKTQTWNEILCQHGCHMWREKGKNRREDDQMAYQSVSQRGPQAKQSTDDEGGEMTNDEWTNGNELPQNRVSTHKKRSVRTRKNYSRDVNSENLERGSLEKEIQCALWNEDQKQSEFLIGLNDSIRTLHLLIGELRKKSPQEKKKEILTDIGATLEKIGGAKSLNSLQNCLNLFNSPQNEEINFMEGDEINVKDMQKTIFVVKQLCEELSNEKINLTEKLSEKNKIILSMKTKERDYLNLISNLKYNLEKLKKDSEESGALKRDLQIARNKLVEEKKVIEALKKSHGRLQEVIQKYVLDNDKLRAQVKLTQMESQKFSVLLAGKEEEVRKYKTEIESFQRHISNQLNKIRSKASTNDVQSAIDFITRQTNFLSQTEGESVMSETTTDKADGRFTPSSKGSLMSLWTQTKTLTNTNQLEDQESVLSQRQEELGNRKPSSDSTREGKDRKVKDTGYTSCKSDESDGNDSKEEVNSTGNDESQGRYDSGLRGVLTNSKILRSNIGGLLKDMKTKLTEAVGGPHKGNNNSDEVSSSTDITSEINLKS